MDRKSREGLTPSDALRRGLCPICQKTTANSDPLDLLVDPNGENGIVELNDDRTPICCCANCWLQRYARLASTKGTSPLEQRRRHARGPGPLTDPTWGHCGPLHICEECPRRGQGPNNLATRGTNAANT